MIQKLIFLGALLCGCTPALATFNFCNFLLRKPIAQNYVPHIKQALSPFGAHEVELPLSWVDKDTRLHLGEVFSDRDVFNTAAGIAAHTPGVLPIGNIVMEFVIDALEAAHPGERFTGTWGFKRQASRGDAAGNWHPHVNHDFFATLEFYSKFGTEVESGLIEHGHLLIARGRRYHRGWQEPDQRRITWVGLINSVNDRKPSE